MKGYIEERIIREAEYIIENNCTVRQAAYVFGISKSTIHTDVSVRLLKLDRALHEKVRKVLSFNFSVRHIRGGATTKRKYQAKKI